MYKIKIKLILFYIIHKNKFQNMKSLKLFRRDYDLEEKRIYKTQF